MFTSAEKKKMNGSGKDKEDLVDSPPKEQAIVTKVDSPSKEQAIVTKNLLARRAMCNLRSIPRSLFCCSSTSVVNVSEVGSGSVTSNISECYDFESFFIGDHTESSSGPTDNPICLRDSNFDRLERLERLDEQSVSTMGTGKTRTRNECAICSELVVGPRFIGVCIPCGHFFHEDCFFGSWASALLHDIEQGGNEKKISDLECISARCEQCGVPVHDFGSISITTGGVNVVGAAGPSDGFGESLNDFALRKLMAKAKMTSLVRQGISAPSSPKMVIQVLRVTMNRLTKARSATRAEFLAVGGHVAMLHAVARYSECEEIWGWVNAIMAELCTGYADVLYLTTPNLAGFVASSMQQYPEQDRLQSNGCCTFSELCKSSFAKESLKDISSVGGLLAVTNAIARYSCESVSLCWNAISFLVLAAQIDPMLVCGHVLSESQAFECLLATLKEPLVSTSPVCVRLVCTLLLIASRNPSFREVIVQSGGVEALQALYPVAFDHNTKAMVKIVLHRLGEPLQAPTPKDDDLKADSDSVSV